MGLRVRVGARVRARARGEGEGEGEGYRQLVTSSLLVLPWHSARTCTSASSGPRAKVVSAPWVRAADSA